MTLLCSETGERLRYEDRIWSLTSESADQYYVLSDSVVSAIPKGLQRNHECAQGLGVNVYAASSGGPTTGGYHSWSSFRLKEFAFSVSLETARKYLPHLCARNPELVAPMN